MPTVGYEFEERSRGVSCVRRNREGWSTSRSARRSGPLRFIVIEALPVIMVRRGLEGHAMRTMRRDSRNATGPQQAEGGGTHDYGAV